MELVQVRIKGMVITSQYGTLESGDILRTSPAFAKHLVEECGAAEYVEAKADAPAESKPVSKKTKTKPE